LYQVSTENAAAENQPLATLHNHMLLADSTQVSTLRAQVEQSLLQEF